MNLRMATIDDIDFILSLYRDEDTAKYMVDDNAGIMPRELLEAAINAPDVFTIIAEEKGEHAGFFLFVPWNYTTYELQSAFKKEYRGEPVYDAGCQVRKWFFTQTKARKCIAMVPTGNYRCKAMVKIMGFQQEGINRKSYLHNGILQDQYIYGLCKEDVSL